jgi:hypothetical protein
VVDECDSATIGVVLVIFFEHSSIVLLVASGFFLELDGGLLHRRQREREWGRKLDRCRILQQPSNK